MRGCSRGLRVTIDGRGTIATDRLEVAAGPRLGEVATMLGVDLPMVHELHGKMRFRDVAGVVPIA